MGVAVFANTRQVDQIESQAGNRQAGMGAKNPQPACNGPEMRNTLYKSTHVNTRKGVFVFDLFSAEHCRPVKGWDRGVGGTHRMMFEWDRGSTVLHKHVKRSLD
jgi:hypothetical protein